MDYLPTPIVPYPVGMIFEHLDELKDRIERFTGRRSRGPVEVLVDSSNYMRVEGGKVLRLGDGDYFIRGDAKEGRFGIDDQPKYWVKYAVDLEDGAEKIIKLVFHEQISTTVADINLRLRRNPYKESAFLELVRGDGRFMQGVTLEDVAGNPIRVIDRIPGKSLFKHMATFTMGHQQYFHEVLPGLMQQVIDCIEALAEVHRRGHHHGDIRNDHILIHKDTGDFSWIDFDYEVNFADYDVWSMGNVLVYTIGQGHHTVHEVRRNPERFPGLDGPLSKDDSMLLFPHRVANLRKLFPWIPQEVSRILMRFSAGSLDFYDDLDEQVRDLKEAFPA